MPSMRALACALSLAALALPARAQLPSSAPANPAGSTAESPMGAGTGLSMGGSMSPELRSRVEQHLRATQDLRQRMANATTPEQRQSLMGEHMRLMDEDMSLMQQMMMMGGGGQMPNMPPMPGPAGMPGSAYPGGTGPAMPPANPTAPASSPGSVR